MEIQDSNKKPQTGLCDLLTTARAIMIFIFNWSHAENPLGGSVKYQEQSATIVCIVICIYAENAHLKRCMQ